MKKPWWIGKNDPAQDYEDDVNGYYGNPTADEDENSENSYVIDDTGDISDVQVAISGDPITEAAKVEPLMKKSFSPKTCQDSRVIVDAVKDGRVAIIYVEELDRENFLRLFDYVMGAVQALDGELIKLDRDTVCVLPYGVEKDADIDALEEAVDEEAEEDGKDAE